MNKILVFCLILLMATITFAFSNEAQLAGTTTRVSIANDGQQGNYNSEDSAISDNGRYVVFESGADNLTPEDYNGSSDIFIYDTQFKLLQRITSGNYGSFDPALSENGQYIVFSSASSNLVPNDQNNDSDIFLYDQQNGTFELVSITSDGQQGDNGSFLSSDISPDGRFVAFVSTAALVANDTNFYHDVYVRDRLLGLTTRVSIDSFGHEGNYQSYSPAISADGRYVAFTSEATNLVANDTNNRADIFFHDRQTGITQRLSESGSGEQGNAESEYPSISDDGRFVVFHSRASNLVANDTNQRYDIFIRDLWLNSLERVSISSSGEEGNGTSGSPAISGSGRFVTFLSFATNLVSGDTTDEFGDIFVRDRQTGVTERINVNDLGQEATNLSYYPAISLNGEQVTFTSGADNLVVGDTNEWIDVFLREMAWPAVTISQTVGAVGSYFGLVASHFPPTSTLSVIVNGNLLGTLPTDSQGQVALELDTTTADPGFYQVRLALDPYWQEVSFTLTETGVVYPSVGWEVVVVPAGIPHHRAFLPLLFLTPNP